MGIMQATSRLESQHPKGHRARRGTRQSGLSAGYLQAPISSSPPHSSKGQRKKEAKLGSSCSGIKRLTLVHVSLLSIPG